MRFHIMHETRYNYNVPVYAVAMEARLQPSNDDFQSCQRYKLTVTPRTHVQTYTTFSDVIVHYWTLLKASEILVTSECEVDVRPRPMQAEIVPPQPIDFVDLFPYLEPSHLTAITPAIRDFAAPFAKLAREDWYQTALAVSNHIHDVIEFELGYTHVQTTAPEVLQIGRGVCQDFTHLMTATMRALGIPTRYVSGYLNPHMPLQTMQSQNMQEQAQTQAEPIFNAGGFAYQSMSQTLGDMTQSLSANSELPGERSVRGTGASHAWVEVYLGAEIGWRGFDPTNNLLIDQHFVQIGAGRDFTDLTPLKGVHKGPAEERLVVTVNVG